MQQFEQRGGAVPFTTFQGQRTLDLDLLIYGQQQIQNERLTVPHIGILDRDFVVIPLLDIDTHLQLSGHPLKDLELVQQASFDCNHRPVFGKRSRLFRSETPVGTSSISLGDLKFKKPMDYKFSCLTCYDASMAESDGIG